MGKEIISVSENDGNQKPTMYYMLFSVTKVKSNQESLCARADIKIKSS